MINLNEVQKEFILDTFFKNDDYFGWNNIATLLIEKGKCVVAGTECIWDGGIGNFIKTETSNDYIDCLIYKFDLEEFLHSNWFMEINSYAVDQAEREFEKAQHKFNSLLTLPYR